MKNKSSTTLISIKTNDEIVKVLQNSKKFNIPFAMIRICKQPNKSQIQYGLLVNKTQFKLAVERNKVKRQLRNILINSELKGGIKLLIKPNSTWLKKDYFQLKELIINIITKYQNGK